MNACHMYLIEMILQLWKFLEILQVANFAPVPATTPNGRWVYAH